MDKGLKGSLSHSRGVRRGVVIPLRAVGLFEGEMLVFPSPMDVPQEHPLGNRTQVQSQSGSRVSTTGGASIGTGR
jgi:hypothetical protein